MTEDRNVFALFRAFVAPFQTATSCLTRQNELVIIASGTLQTCLRIFELSGPIWGQLYVARFPFSSISSGRRAHLRSKRITFVSGDKDLRSTEELIIHLLGSCGLEVVLTMVKTTAAADIEAQHDS